MATETQFCWLIEAPGRRYLASRKLGHYYDFHWTESHDKALRFFSEEQADFTMMAVRQMDREYDALQNYGGLRFGKLFSFEHSLGNAKAVEHGFMGASHDPR